LILERIAVVGIGRLGLCLALSLDQAGYQVLGVDKNRERVRLISEKALHTSEPGVQEALVTARAFCATACSGAIGEFDPDLVFVAVDTATVEAGVYDHRSVDHALTELFSLRLARGRVELALVSTASPGYCDAKAGSAMGHGFALSYTPASVAQGSILRDQQFPDQVLIGEADAVAGEKLTHVFGRLCRNQPAIHRMSRLSAEIAKLAINCALTAKIAFANAIGDLATCVGAEPERILNALGTDTRIGSKFLTYGFGYGGPCFPRDNRALNVYAKQKNCEVLQAGITDEMNRRHLAFQVAHYLRAYRDDEPIHFHSVTYKPGTEILEESQPLAVAVELARAGRKIVIHESPAVLEELRRRFGDLFEYHIGASG
jgi:UDPglucose 6-dehydrogenase